MHTTAFPIRATVTWLVASSSLFALVCFWFLSAGVRCGIDALVCQELVGIGILALAIGVAFGLFVAAAFLGFRFTFQKLSRKNMHTGFGSRTLGVAVLMFAAHLGVFGVLHMRGDLPLGWTWWLGFAGFIGSPEPGGVYIHVPTK